MDGPKVLRISRVAAELDCSRTTIYELIRQGQLPALRVGKALKVPAADVDAFIQRRLAEGAGTAPRVPAA